MRKEPKNPILLNPCYLELNHLNWEDWWLIKRQNGSKDNEVRDSPVKQLINPSHFTANNIYVKVFKNGPSKICGRQPLKNLKRYDLPKQTMSLQSFKGCLPQILLGPFLAHSSSVVLIVISLKTLATKKFTKFEPLAAYF